MRHLLSSVRSTSARGEKSVLVTPSTAQGRGWRQEAGGQLVSPAGCVTGADGQDWTLW